MYQRGTFPQELVKEVKQVTVATKKNLQTDMYHVIIANYL